MKALRTIFALAALALVGSALALVQPQGYAGKSLLRAANSVSFRGSSEGSSAFSPTDIAGLQLWLDASQIVGLNDGDAVATWTDLSAVGNDLTQSTASSRPTYYSTSPRVVFDGIDDFLENLTFTGGYTPEIFVRFSILTHSGSGILMCNPDNAYGSGTYGLASGNFGANISSGAVPASGAFPLNTVGIVRVYYARGVGANAAKFAINGVEQSWTCAAGDYLAPTFDKINLGRYPAGAAFYQNAAVKQVLIYSSPLTAAQRLQVEAYLAALP